MAHFLHFESQIARSRLISPAERLIRLALLRLTYIPLRPTSSSIVTLLQPGLQNIAFLSLPKKSSIFDDSPLSQDGVVVALRTRLLSRASHRHGLAAGGESALRSSLGGVLRARPPSVLLGRLNRLVPLLLRAALHLRAPYRTSLGPTFRSHPFFFLPTPSFPKWSPFADLPLDERRARIDVTTMSTPMGGGCR